MNLPDIADQVMEQDNETFVKVVCWWMPGDTVVLENLQGRQWPASYEAVKKDLTLQEQADREQVWPQVHALFEAGDCCDKCPTSTRCFQSACPAKAAVVDVWVQDLQEVRQHIFDVGGMDELTPDP